MNAYQNFTGKSAQYTRYRPGYPQELLKYLDYEIGLKGKIVADIGSGTGIFSRFLSPVAGMVYAVEPNDEMRAVSQKESQAFNNLKVLPGSAEATGLPEESLDLVTAAQAFHWFEADQFRQECRRILKPYGQVILVWNSLLEGSPVSIGLSRLCRAVGLDCSGFHAGRLKEDTKVDHFFAGGQYRQKSFPNHLALGWDGFQGRYLSSSYAPRPGAPGYQPYLEGLAILFGTLAQNDRLTLPYETLLFYGAI